MTTETSNARGEWVLVPRELTQEMRSALARAVNASCNTDEWYAHTLAASPPPSAARGDVRGLVALAEQMERDAAGCRRDGYTDAAVVKEDCAQRIRQTLGISAIAEALAAEGVQAGEVEDGPIDASDNAEYIEHCADRLERCGLRATAGALRVIAHEHRTLVQQSAPPSAPVAADWITGDGLQGIKAEAHFLTQHKEEAVQRAGKRLLDRADKIIAALYQPPSAPVGVEAIAAEIRASLGRGATVCTRRRWAIELEALAQQPAAVDGVVGTVTRVGSFEVQEHRIELDPEFDERLNNMPEGTVVRLYAAPVRDLTQKQLADAAATLAAQHQEPKS